MPSPTQTKTPICEQCGAPLLTAVSDGCLNCLLSTGIESKKRDLAASASEPVTRVDRDYEILTHPDGSLWELGRGAMGVTYKARHLSLNVVVALKVINARFSGRSEARERFLREAQAAAQLRHPNVASVFHFGTIDRTVSLGGAKNGEKCLEAGNCFYAMEFLEGESLEARLRRTGPLDLSVALEIALQVARALATAEKRGLVHRDVKPSNIMLVAEEEVDPEDRIHAGNPAAWVKVIDFGLAKLADEGAEPVSAKRFLGTPAFSSPEQKAARNVDHRSDIYSLGVTLWYSLTGKLPGAQEGNAPLPVTQLFERNVPKAIVLLLESMLAPDPEDRPRSARELTEKLDRNLRLITAPGHSSRQQARRHRAIVTGLGVAASLAGLSLYLMLRPLPAPDKSVAVLPFRNLSTDPHNAFFAEGVQDDIVSRLVKVRDLKVIGRRGALSASISKPTDLREVGRMLGVRHLLEGSLRRFGDRVLLHVSLIDSADGREIWSEGYDRKLVDAINLQGELASNIADALKAQLSPQERIDLKANTSHNPDAYVLYLQGRKLENSPTFQVSNYEAAQALYTQAVVLDPNFALAHAQLASALGLIYRFRGPSEDLRTRAYAEVHEALRLQPYLGEAHLAKGLADYWIASDFVHALPELEIAQHLLPNDSEPDSTIALIRRRQGRWRQARTGLEQVQLRDPLNRKCAEELHATACLLRDWPEAARHGDRAVQIEPVIEPLRVERAMVDFWQSGNLRPLQNALAAIASYQDEQGDIIWEQWDAAMVARNFSAAQGVINTCKFETLPSVIGAPFPTSYLGGCISLAQGESDQAHAMFERARPSMEAEALAHPNDSMRHARLGLLYAYMGRKTDALKEGQVAVQLTPVAKDAIDGHLWLCNLALIHAWVGHTDRAISMIQSLLQEPGCVSPLNEASLTLWDLRLRWQWDPLRRDPRFQKILNGPEPPTLF